MSRTRKRAALSRLDQLRMAEALLLRQMVHSLSEAQLQLVLRHSATHESRRELERELGVRTVS